MKIEIKILNKEFYSIIEKTIPHGTPTELIGNLPAYATPGSAAMDLVCTEDVLINPGETKMIPTGLAIWIGSDGGPTCKSEYNAIAGLVLPRSGLGTKGLILANTAGVIDDDYQGELMIQVWNRRNKLHLHVEIEAGDRFAQLMFIPVVRAQWQVVEEFSQKTVRGRNGHGSTGLKM